LGGLLNQRNVVLADNENGNCEFDAPLSGTLRIGNLSSDNTCGFGPGRDNVDPLLGPLADNGGPTRTHLPGPGSPAIDGGTTSGCPATDQRGAARPGGVSCDVGAVEADATVPTTTTTISPTATTTSTTLPSGTCSAPCVTVDPCRPQTCVEGACLAQDVTGLASTSCACQRPAPAVCGELIPPSKVRKTAAKACNLLNAAAVRPPGGRRVRKLVKAGRKWRAAGRLVLKPAAQRALGPECAAALAADYDDAARRVDVALQSGGG
jgi:hypothetical protein